MFLKIAQKVTKYLGHFCKKDSDQKLSSFAQSGHAVVVVFVNEQSNFQKISLSTSIKKY